MKCPMEGCNGKLVHVWELNERGYSSKEVWYTFYCDCCEAQLKCKKGAL